MEKRNTARYIAAHLPVEMASALLVLPDNSIMEAAVVDISSIGIKLKVALPDARPMIPGPNDIVKIRLLLSEQIELSSLCMWSDVLEQDFLDLGFYFYNPHEQNSLYELLSSIKMSSGRYNEYEISGTEERFISYEWEELVDRMYHSDNPELRKIGMQKMKNIEFRAWARHDVPEL